MNSNSVDPKEVLKLMNGLGYKNITANELKEFTKDLKKLMKFEIKARSPNESISNKRCPENIINVTIINGSKHKENVKPSESSKEVQKTTETQSQLTSEANSAASTRRRKLLSKRLLLLPKHVKTRRTNIVHKKGTADDMNDGVLVRNTPADLYQKYQNDWNKFKSFIPGESIRRDIRESVRSKMQHKPEEPPKVYVYFANDKTE